MEALAQRDPRMHAFVIVDYTYSGYNNIQFLIKWILITN